MARLTVTAGHRGDNELAVSNLKHPAAEVRSAALGALRRTGALNATWILEALSDPAPSVRRRAVEMAVQAPAIDLAPALGDDESSVVDVAAWACGEREDVSEPEFDALCSVAMRHDDPICRESAVAALGAIGDERALPAILEATTDKPAVRRRAALALAPFEGRAVDEALARMLEDRDWQVRQAAEDLLGS